MDLDFGAYRLRTRERELLGPEGPVDLGARSFEILLALLQRPNELVGKTQLLDLVWPGVAVEENTLHVHVSALRKALGPGYLATVHGRGYRYVGPLPRTAERSIPASDPRKTGNIDLHRVECIARESEVATLTHLLGEQRLVSIVGPGGVGKTTLAMRVAAEVGKGFAHGVWVIDLASLADAGHVGSAIIQTRGIPFRPGTAELASILDAFSNEEALLVLDNCEHVAEAVAELTRALLAGAPGLRILTTTQVPLRLEQERIFRLAPFSLELAGQSSDGSETPAGRFLAHCYESLGEAVAPGEWPAIERLCRRLDGVALALKMAASRAASLGIEVVDRQLAEHIEGLDAGWQPGLARHRSLLASLGWSYGLLSENARKSLRSLGVFQGSFTLPAALVVAEASEETIAELIGRSLLIRDGNQRSRYRLLETTRLFALERLAEAAEEAAARDRHARFVLGQFQRSLEDWEQLPDQAWLAIYRLDGDNLRMALSWSLEQGNWPLHVALAANSYRFWIQSQLPGEGMRIGDGAGKHADAAEAHVVALLHLGLAELARVHRQDLLASEHLEAALAFFRKGGEIGHLVQAIILKGTILLIQEEWLKGAQALAELGDLISPMPVSKLKARALVVEGMSRWISGDREVGWARYEAGLAMQGQLGNLRGRFKSIMMFAEHLHSHLATGNAIELVTRILPELRRDGTPEELGFQCSNLAAYYLALDNTEAAAGLVAEAAACLAHEDSNGYWCVLQNAAHLAIAAGKMETAALLLGFVDHRFEGWADGRQSTEVMQRQRMLTQLEEKFTSAELQKLLAQGADLTLFEADVVSGLADGARPDGRR